MADPHDDAAALASLLQELAARSVSDQVAAVQRYRVLLEEIASGRVDAGALRSRYDRLVSEQSAQLARDVSAIGMRFYQSMLDLHRASVDRLFDGLAGAAGVAGANGGEEAPPSAPPAAELVLRGGAGGEARTRSRTRAPSLRSSRSCCRSSPARAARRPSAHRSNSIRPASGWSPTRRGR
jgi:hypothetical protein